ncbi:winged helix DNA-binding domain-containing protein [Actinoplanes sp. URMC 104]|uniref:winged helix DNA-binding domain-containing protein n=1 Tax=Actinoplanes sp. URMC 104 TaxID=3423409 RepID=UPI003F1B3AB8
MDASTALGLRMSSLLLRGNGFPTVAGTVEWFGAMQAQDVNSGLWSLGARVPGATLASVNAALEERSVLRTWPMRGTVHFVPAADAHWMLELMGVRALAGATKRRETLGLDESTVDRAVDVLGSALAGGGRLTRSQCLAAMVDGGVEVTGQRGYHLLWYASQRAVTAIAPHVGKEQTFVLLDEWVPEPRRPSREEALGIIALRYFRSHGPASRKDFAGWTGLTMTDCRTGIAVAGDQLTTVDVDGAEMIAATAALDGGTTPDAGGWLALPGFDEYLLGYKDRSLMASADDLAAIIPGGNGVFRSTLVRAGRVVATWTRTLTRKGVTVTVQPLVAFTPDDHAAAADALGKYAAYLELPLTVKNP